MPAALMADNIVSVSPFSLEVRLKARPFEEPTIDVESKQSCKPVSSAFQILSG